jgi:hypothetical protein
MPVTAAKRFLVGGIGGLAPVLALLIAVDFDKISGASAAHVAGYVVRALALFAIGGFVAWLHESENQLFKVFEIGLGAPALIAGLVTSNSLVNAPAQPDAQKPAVAWTLPFISSAQARTTGELPPAPAAAASPASPVASGAALPARTFTFPEPSTGSQFLEGLLGVPAKQPANIYYVISGSHLEAGEAWRQADAINARKSGFSAQVYAPYGGNPHYAVVIGAQLSKGEANTLRLRAQAAGLPHDTYVWTDPGLRH